MFQRRQRILARQEIRVVMAWWLVREKRAQQVMIELPGKAMRRRKTADPPSPRLRRPGRPLPVARPARATLRRALLVVRVQQSDRLARVFFAPDRQL